MIDVKQAVTNAVKYLIDVFADRELKDVRLEEVELAEDERFWHVTLSFLREPSPGGLAAALGVSADREYKVVTLSSETGEVRSIKIRQLV